jgi:hypothetical protein
MARRASSRMNLGTIAGIAAAIVALVVVGAVLLRGGPASQFSDLPELQVDQFLDNANSLRGSEYRVSGKVSEKLRWTPDRGQVISLEVGEDGRTELLPIQIPGEFSNLNIEREQRYSFKVKVRDGGIPVATGIERM